MTMQRVRRLAVVAVVAVIAVTGLSACRTEPGVAAYLAAGDISLKRVRQVYDDALAKHSRARAKAKAEAAAQPSPAAPGAAEAAAAAKLPITSENVLDTLISHAVLSRVAQKHNVRVPGQLPLQDFANVLKLPVDAEYVRLFVEVEGLQIVLNQNATAATVTPADINEVYNRIRAENAVDPNTSAQQFADNLSAEGKKVLGTAVAVRNDVRDDISKQHIRLNPRFQPFDVPVLTQRGQDGSGLVLLGVPVGDRAGLAPVTDAR
jgi:hypothetical protein